jgi:hypothetical protein
MPSTARNIANGRSAGGGEALFLSVRADTTMRRTALAKNSLQNADASVMYGS